MQREEGGEGQGVQYRNGIQIGCYSNYSYGGDTHKMSRKCRRPDTDDGTDSSTEGGQRGVHWARQTDRQTGQDIRADRESTWLAVSFVVHVTDETQMQLSLYFKRFMRETTVTWQSVGRGRGREGEGSGTPEYVDMQSTADSSV